MSHNNYFRKNYTPSLYLLSHKFKGQTRPADYARVARDGLLFGRALYPRLVAVLTTWCTLKCRDCNNLMACYEKPYHLDPDQVLFDIETLLEGVDTLTELELIGGEPFVYPHLEHVLKRVLDNKKILFVSLTSNGTVLPPENILKLLAHPRVRVELSDYGVKSQKMDSVCALFDSRGILYDRNEDLSWVSPGGVERRGKSIVQLAREYQNCFSFKYCNTIFKGRVYHCSRAAHLSDLGYMDFPEDSFDIHEKRDPISCRKAFRQYWLSPYTMACDYCDHALKKKVRAGLQAGGGGEQGNIGKDCNAEVI